MLALSGIVLVASVVIGQTEREAATTQWPAEAVKCTEYLMGTWEVEGKFGNDDFKGTWSCHWARGRCAYYITASGKRGNASDKVDQMAALGGFDIKNMRFVEQVFWSNGAILTMTYPFNPALVDRGPSGGEMAGIVNGKDVKGKIDLERKGPTEFVWSSTADNGERTSLTFKKTAEPNRAKGKGERRP